MSIRPFTSESYSEAERPGAWEGVLSAVGLRAYSTPQLYGHATALFRESAGVILARLAAGPQTLSAVKRGAGLPIILLSKEDGAVLRSGNAHHIVPTGHLLILPSGADAQVLFQRDLRAVVLSVAAEAFHGRKTSPPFAGTARTVAPQGFPKIVAALLEVASGSMETLADVEWKTVSENLAELALALIHQGEEHIGETGSIGQAALLHRICLAIERALDDPELSPAQVARSEGISERYLQRLFEATGDSFSHYIRERRLHRSSVDLANPAQAHCSVSEIAFRYGFSDAAHFSRVFRDRFGMSPRAYRHQEAEQINAVAISRGQRGWPQDALAQLRTQKPPPVAVPSVQDYEAAETANYKSATPISHYLAATAEHVHWGYFSRSLKPVIEIASGDIVTVETLTQHASDDPERMIEGDAGAESVFHWSSTRKEVDRRGAGPVDASIYGRGAGEGFGVHICTGPIAMKDAQPGDVLEVRILDIAPRPSGNPKFEGRTFGSSVSAWWGYQYGELLTEPRPREDVTIYEMIMDQEPYAQAVYSYRWEPQTDPFGVIHKTYDYPGVPVAGESIRRRHAVLEGIRIPLRLHFGVIALAPKEFAVVDSIPPAYFGGNLDNWRAGKGSAVYLPVSVPGALLSIGDPHAAQGDGEVGGTAIECSMTGTFRVTLHKKARLSGTPFADLTYPLIETPKEWVLMGFSHPNYLAEFGATGQSEVYSKSSLDLAMKDAFRKMRRFLMALKGLNEDEAIALMSAAVDFGVTQVVDGNWGVHATIRKSMFSDSAGA
jgi:acetamidase/formamidase/AraC-like DNA-binding protein